MNISTESGKRTGNIFIIEGGMILKQYCGNLWSRVPHTQVLYNISYQFYNKYRICNAKLNICMVYLHIICIKYFYLLIYIISH